MLRSHITSSSISKKSYETCKSLMKPVMRVPNVVKNGLSSLTYYASPEANTTQVHKKSHIAINLDFGDICHSFLDAYLHIACVGLKKLCWP